MNAVDKVKSICKERKIPISKLEKDLGFSNGYIGQLRKGTFPNDRLFKIADYLDVPVSELSEDEQKEKAPANAEAKDEYEISHFMEALESSGTLMYDGVPISDAAKESIRAAMRLGLEAAKIESKKKFTPKKYRKD